MKRAVIVICDGHRDDFVKADLCPAICALETSGRRFARHHGIYPSVTRASVASFATGCWPANHGLHGNMMAIDEGEGLVLRDAGAPEIFGAMRRAFGRTLKVATMAERIAQATGNGASAFVISNASPGAARFHDPDHRSFVYHRAGSFAPGGVSIENDPQAALGKDGRADRTACERFCEELASSRPWRLAVLWLCEPDTTMHATVLGSSDHKAAINGADACVGRVAAAVDRLRAAGQDVLFMVGSDHGQETVANAIPLEALLIEAGLKDGPDSREVVVAPQGSAAHVYLAGHARQRLRKIESFCRDHAWCGAVLTAQSLRTAGLEAEFGLELSIAMRKHDEPNPNGVPGVTDVVTSEAKPSRPQGFGTHGGLGAFERRPFLVATGGGMQPGSIEYGRSRLIDIAPTVLAHLGIGRGLIDGLPLPRG